MAEGQFGTGAGFVGGVTRPPSPADSTDKLLLERFARHRDEAAFAALVRRHGPMVLGVCQRVLHNLHDAEDAFQATFLVLVRKSGSLARPELLANWLHGVACRMALNARAEGARRRGCERRVVDMPVEATTEVVWRDLRPVLDEEVNRLPDVYRVPFVLCYLEGKTNDEAARHLGCPKGTVLSRLARARAQLRGRLARRGLALSAGSFAAILAERIGSAALSAVLADSTTRAAMQFAVGEAGTAGVISAKVAALTQGVLRTMFLARLKMVSLLALLLGLVAGGAVLVSYRAGAVEPARQKEARAPKDGDKRKLQGTWYTVSVESHGMKIPEARILAKGVRLVVEGDRWTLKEMQGDADKKYMVGLDPAKNPKAIDVVYKTGPNKGKTSLGIYELDGSTLRICVGEPGDPRPTKFDGGGTYTLEVFKREKPKAADPASDKVF
jgi:RNA polymerase sigma-70 factor (ECF subfamily)